MMKEKLLEDIKNHPERHKHKYSELLSCCTINNIIDFNLIEAHSEFVNLGTNGGVKCDTIEGPCACGAWH